MRKILANGTVTRFAGGGSRRQAGPGPATEGVLRSPTELVVLTDGTVVFADVLAVYTVTPSGLMTALTSLRQFQGLTADVDSGTIYVCDLAYNQVFSLTRLRPLGANGTAPVYGPLVIVAGRGDIGHSGDGGPATLASLAGPISLALFRDQLYIAEVHGDCVRVVNVTSGIVSTFAGAVASVGGPPVRGEHVTTRSFAFALGPGFLDVIMAPSFVERLDYATWGVASVAGTGASRSSVS